MNTTTITVTGMTCEHCANSVKEEVTNLAEVTSVEVDVPTGVVTIQSNNPLDPAAVAIAIDEAGYQIKA